MEIILIILIGLCVLALVALDVCIDDYAEKLDIMEQIVSLHNAQGNADE